MIIIIFLVITVLLTLTDMKAYWIPNFIVIPAIVLGIALTGDWLWALSLFTIGACFFHRGIIAGGDVKLMTMGGAFLGWITLPAFILSRIIVWGYKDKFLPNTPLPYAPFFLISNAIIIATSQVIRWLIIWPALNAGGVRC